MTDKPCSSLDDSVFQGGLPLWWKLSKIFYKTKIRISKGPWILGYHRVIDNTNNVDATTFDNFKNHIEYLKRNTELLPIMELLKRVEENKSSGNEVAITFDDGYIDQGMAARYAMEQGVPSAIFIAASYPDSGKSFYWEGRNTEECETIKEQMRSGANPPEGLKKSSVLSWDEIIKLYREGINIELHGNTHRLFSGLSNDEIKEEFIQSINLFQNKLDKNPELLVYPNGDWNDIDIRINDYMHKYKIKYGLMAVFGRVMKKHFPYRIRRVLVTNQTVHELECLIKSGYIPANVKMFTDSIRGRK